MGKKTTKTNDTDRAPKALNERVNEALMARIKELEKVVDDRIKERDLLERHLEIEDEEELFDSGNYEVEFVVKVRVGSDSLAQMRKSSLIKLFNRFHTLQEREATKVYGMHGYGPDGPENIAIKFLGEPRRIEKIR